MVLGPSFGDVLSVWNCWRVLGVFWSVMARSLLSESHCICCKCAKLTFDGGEWVTVRRRRAFLADLHPVGAGLGVRFCLWAAWCAHFCGVALLGLDEVTNLDVYLIYITNLQLGILFANSCDNFCLLLKRVSECR